jgi:NAD(P)-dependent dehydrogenase (short-subunit alcohol dehydrogenase family)
VDNSPTTLASEFLPCSLLPFHVQVPRLTFVLSYSGLLRAATISLSHQLATEFARRDLGVRVNTIAPGYFPSGMTDTSTSDEGGKAAFKKDWGIPFGRPGNAQDYAQCVISTITVSPGETEIEGCSCEI